LVTVDKLRTKATSADLEAKLRDVGLIRNTNAVGSDIDSLSNFDGLDAILCINFPECAVVCTENLNPNVLTMKSAQYGARIYDARSLNLARDRRILVQ
jgi:hypothetical protein